MKCRNCKAELKEGATVCPACGEPTKQAAKKPKKKLSTWVMALIITVSVLGVLAGAVAIWWSIADVESFSEGWQLILNAFDPPENDVYYKDSYSVSAKKAAKWREKVVANVGGEQLTNGELQVYYWMNVYEFLKNYGTYAAYVGLDYTLPLDEQTCIDTEGSWQHFFLDDALMNWNRYQAMALLAQKAGMELSEDVQEELDGLRKTMAQAAVEAGFSSIDAMLQCDMGPGCTFDDYYSYSRTYQMGYLYFREKYDAAEAAIDDARLEAYFTANEDTLAESGITKESGYLYDVRHILIAPEGGTEDGDGNVTYTDEEWEACRAAAQAVLDEWLAGEATEESFAVLANEHSIDTGSNTNGGLYEGLDTDTNFVQEYKNWYLADGRKVGDYGLVKSDYGYHIMYLSDVEEEWIAASREGILTEVSSNITKEAMDAYSIQVDYKNIVLGVVDLSQTQG